MKSKYKKALFAAGCFWRIEEAFYKTPGVVETIVGYAGGHTENPTYAQVSSHTTGHAETVEVTFDPQKISYQDLLEVFWSIHDPTTPNRQGPDIGSNYRSAIFYINDEQKDAALKSKRNLEKSGRFKKPIVTEIVKAGVFWPAEDYHQKYFLKHANRSCPT
jgi:peptide-methionine (S)-S-oxide reductase